MSETPDPFAPGDRIGPYQVVGLLATGGMGRVYRARDARLAREVAIKVLPATLAADPDRLRRFEQEARVAGALAHPNVLVVHDVGTHAGSPYLVTELLDGETLRERLATGPLPARAALEIALRLAQGLAAAHDKGVVHRDLKPSNVFLTRDGRVKVLDFGLAKITGPRGVDPDAETLAGRPAAETRPGVVLGTVGYMAPEQVRGQEADARSDVFALGVILFEMLWGRRAFAGESGVEVLSAILRDDPLAEQTTPDAVGAALEQVVRRCLEKNPAERYQTARDIAFTLEALAAGGDSGAVSAVSDGGTWRALAAAARGRRLGGLRTAALLALGALAGLASGALLRPEPAPQITGYRPLLRGMAGTPTRWVSDGRHVYFSLAQGGRYGVWQEPLVGGEPLRLETPFEQALVVDASARHAALLVIGWNGRLTDAEAGDQPLWILPVPGGAARNTGLAVFTAAWSPDGERLAWVTGSDDYARKRPATLHVGRADGSAGRVVYAGENNIVWLRWSPDGTRIRFGVFDRARAEWWWLELPSDGSAPPRPLTPGESGSWSPDGRHLVFGRWGKAARGTPFEEPRFNLHLRSEAPFWRGGARERQLTFGPLDFARPVFTPDGRRLVALGSLRRMELLRLVDGRFERSPDDRGGFVDYSPDGEWLAWVDASNMTLWRSRRDGGARLQLTSPPMAVGVFRWSPDGRRLLFVADPSGGRQPRAVFLVSRDGGALESHDDPGANLVWDPCWLDAGTIAWGNLSGAGSAVHTVELASGRRAIVPGSEGMMGPKCSAAGDVLAARSWTLGYWLYRHATGQWEDLGLPSDLWYPTWTRDGHSLYGLSLDARAIYRIDVATRSRERVADIGAVEPTAPWLEAWMGLDAEDRPLLLRDTGFSELFVLDWSP